MASVDPIAVMRLSKDLALAGKMLSRNQARYFVDSYYQIQDFRKMTGNQIGVMAKAGEPCDLLDWLNKQNEVLEGQIKRALEKYAEAHRVGRWAMSQYGIGPVISAGLLAHLGNPAALVTDKVTGAQVYQSPTVGKIWRFAGLDPTMVWEKKTKRPYNAKLKVLCWKIGQSFLKFHNAEECIYGRIFKQRWELEKQRNEAGLFKDQAVAKLANFKIGKDTDAYKAYSEGKLPPAHILQRSCRYATKLFLSHWHAVAWEAATGEKPPKPYVVEHLGHAEIIQPPGWPCA